MQQDCIRPCPCAPEDIFLIMDILQVFEEASGLHNNVQKSFWIYHVSTWNYLFLEETI
jgi:hypothetical protein